MQPGSWIPAHNKTNGYADPNSPATKQPWQRVKLFQDQDVAITESIGARYDRTRESLGSTDLVIMQTRRRLMAAARAVQQGEEPPGLDPKDYRKRPFSCLLPRDCKSWSEAVAEAIDARPETWRPSI